MTAKTPHAGRDDAGTLAAVMAAVEAFLDAEARGFTTGGPAARTPWKTVRRFDLATKAHSMQPVGVDVMNGDEPSLDSVSSLLRKR